MIYIQKEILVFLNQEGIEPPSTQEDVKEFLNFFSSNYYTVNKIKKGSRSKGFRTIQAPIPSLKLLQQKILLDLQSKIIIHRNAYGLNQNDFKANALRHQDSKEILCVDLKDFYQTIGLDIILNESLTRDNYWLYLIATQNKICIPTGSPLSPIISTLIMRSIDDYLSSEIEEVGGIYTRYFDDITISFKKKLSSIEKSLIFYKVSDTISFSKLSMNWSKTKWLAFNNDKIKITGVDIRNIPKVNNSHIRETIRPKINNMIVSTLDYFTSAKNRDQLLRLIRVHDEELGGYLAYIEHVNRDQFNSILDYAFKRLVYIKSLKQTN